MQKHGGTRKPFFKCWPQWEHISASSMLKGSSVINLSQGSRGPPEALYRTEDRGLGAVLANLVFSSGRAEAAYLRELPLPLGPRRSPWPLHSVAHRAITCMGCWTASPAWVILFPWLWTMSPKIRPNGGRHLVAVVCPSLGFRGAILMRENHLLVVLL